MLTAYYHWSEMLDLTAEIILIVNSFHAHDSNIICIHS